MNGRAAFSAVDNLRFDSRQPPVYSCKTIPHSLFTHPRFRNLPDHYKESTKAISLDEVEDAFDHIGAGSDLVDLAVPKKHLVMAGSFLKIKALKSSSFGAFADIHVSILIALYLLTDNEIMLGGVES